MNSAISGQFPQLVLVPNKGSTDATYAEPKWYQYHDNVVPVPLLPVTLIFCILTLLSSNSNTEGIRTLIND